MSRFFENVFNNDTGDWLHVCHYGVLTLGLAVIGREAEAEGWLRDPPVIGDIAGDFDGIGVMWVDLIEYAEVYVGALVDVDSDPAVLECVLVDFRGPLEPF